MVLSSSLETASNMGPRCKFPPVDISNFLNDGDPVLSSWHPLTYILLSSVIKSLMSTCRSVDTTWFFKWPYSREHLFPCKLGPCSCNSYKPVIFHEINHLSKVRIFWEAQKNLRNLPHALDIYLVNVQSMRKIAQFLFLLLRKSEL